MYKNQLDLTSIIKTTTILSIFVIFIFGYNSDTFVYIPIPEFLQQSYLYLIFFAVVILSSSPQRITLSKTTVLLTVLITLLICYYASTLFWAPVTSYAIIKSYLVYIELSTLVLFSVFFFSSNRKNVKMFYFLTLSLVLIVLAEMIYQYLLVGTLTSPQYVTYYITINRTLGIGIPILIYIALSNNKAQIWLIVGAIAATNLFFMTQTGGRGPLIAVIVSSCVYCAWVLVIGKSDNSLPGSQLLTVISGITAAGFIFVTQVNGATIRRLNFLANGPGDSIQGRIEMATASVRFFSEAPVFGHGIGSFKSLYFEGPFSYPHNIFLEFLVESGVIGAFLFIAILTIVFFVIVRNGRENPVYSGLILSCIVFFLLNAVVSSDIPSNSNLFIFSIASLSLIDFE